MLPDRSIRGVQNPPLQIRHRVGRCNGLRWLNPERVAMLNLVLLIGLIACQSSPVDPSRDVQSGGNQVSPGDLWISADLESFDSDGDLREDRKVFPVENLHLDYIHLDKSVAYADGGLTRSMRYDWVDQGTQSVSIGRGIRLPEPVEELWTEVVIRWSPNFTTCHPSKPPCDHKTLFFQVTPDLNGRWSVHFGGGAGEVGPEAHITMFSPTGHEEGSDNPSWSLPRVARSYSSINMVKANSYFDGRWHVMRLHAKYSIDSNTYDGRMRFWMDGELLYDTEAMRAAHGAPGFSTVDGTRIHAILLGRNKDKGLDQGTESMWIGRVRAWRTDPGW